MGRGMGHNPKITFPEVGGRSSQLANSVGGGGGGGGFFEKNLHF